MIGPLVIFDQLLSNQVAVVAPLIGPLQVLITFLPAIALAVGGLLLRLFSPKGFMGLMRLLWRFKFHLATIALVVVGAWWGIGELRYAWGGKNARDVEAGAHDWAMQRGGGERTGAVPGAAAPGSGEVHWSSLAGGMRESTVMSSPAVVGNRIYATTARVALGGGSGAIYALDADTGAVAWRYAPPGFRPTFSSPVVAGKWLAVGEGLHDCQDARLSVLDISGKEPALSWMYTSRHHIESTPAIMDGKVYFGAGDDGYYGFALAPGPDGKPVQLWHLSGERYPDCEVSPLAHDGKVYLTLGVEGHAVLCVDGTTGQELWRVSTPAPVFSPPSLHGGRLYVGMGYGDFINPADHVRQAEAAKMTARGVAAPAIAEFQRGFSAEGAVWCIDLTTHAVLWKARTPKSVLGAVACDDDGAVAVATDGTVLSLGHDGSELGRFSAGAAIKASPAIAGGLVYVVTDQGRLIGLDRRTMRPRFESVLGATGSGFWFSAPAIARGRLFVGTDADGVISVGSPRTVAEVPRWPGEQAGAGSGGTREEVPAAAAGEMLWNLPEGQQDGAPDPVLTSASPALAGGDLVAALTGGGRHTLTCLPFDPARRDLPKARWSADTVNAVRRSPVVVGDLVLAVDGASGTSGRSLTAFARSDGTRRWIHAVADSAGGWLWASEHDLLVEDAPGRLAALALDGSPRWQTDLGGPLAAAAQAEGALVVAAVSEPPTLVLLDRPSGAVLWRCPLPAVPTTAPLLTGDRILVGTAAGMLARSALDGSAAADWAAPGDAVRGGGFLLAPRLLAHATADALLLLDPRSGAVLARHAALPVSPVRVRGGLLFASATDGLRRIDEAQPAAAPAAWADTSWLGQPTTALIAAGDGVAGGFGPWGLVRLGGAK